MTFKVSTTKKRVIFGSVVSFLLLVMTVIAVGDYLALSKTYGILLFVLSLLSSLIVGAVIAVKIDLGEKFNHLASTVFFFVMPFLSLLMSEILNSVYIYWFEPIIFLGNYLFYLMMYGIIYAITGKYNLTVYIFNAILFILALTNNLVYSFRGTVFLPSDILGATTALNVAGTYTFSVTALISMAVIILVFIIVVGSKISCQYISRTRKIVGRSVAATAFIVIISVYLFTDTFANFGIKPDFWNQTRGYHNAGFFSNFCLNIKYLYYAKPAGYNADKIDDIVHGFIQNPLGELITDREFDVHIPSSSDLSSTFSNPSEEESITIEQDGELTFENNEVPQIDFDVIENSDFTVLSERQKLTALLAGLVTEKDLEEKEIPNIICIMNESFSDLAVLGNFTTNIPYMPFYNSLTENCIKGTLYVPVNGAGTSNTEFEFLTGCSTSFLPAGSNPYMSYIKNPIPSIVSTLGSCGYSKLAFHPYYASGWNRPAVYEFMGFSRFRSLGSIIPMSIMSTYSQSGSNPEVLIEEVNKAFPGQDILLRQYVSDTCNHNTIISEYENRDISKPFFIFNVTMQNHGGYTKECSNFNQEVFVTSSSNFYRKTNQYLSLMKRSDDAFKELIEYFKYVEEPTIICMFGDHQPSIETQFIEEVLGKKIDDLTYEELQKRYVTPFVIWANYDIEEKYIDKLSSNYLSTYVLKVAGVQLPTFNKYLYSLSQVLPVIDNVGYIDAEGINYSYNKASKYSTILANYEKIQYNFLFDNKNKRNELYYLDHLDTYGYDEVDNDSSEITVPN